jgi:hypothetical protein
MRPVCLEGSDGFLTSIVAPIAAGWSDPVDGWELHLPKSNTLPRRTIGLTPKTGGSGGGVCSCMHEKWKLVA